MKYILILTMLLIAIPAHAAYWVIDNEVPSKSHTADLTEQDKISLGSYGYVEFPDSLFDAKESMDCKEKFNRLLVQLKNIAKNREKLSNEVVMQESESLINRAVKNINVCLAKEQTDTQKKTKTVKVDASLEKRITALESQMEKILKAIKAFGIKI